MPFTVTLADGQKHTVPEIKDLETLVWTGEISETTMVLDEETKASRRASDWPALDKAFLKYRPVPVTTSTIPESVNVSNEGGGGAMRVFGMLLFLLGLAALYYFMFQFSTAVDNPGQQALQQSLGQPPGDGKTVNLGLMNDRVCGCIVGAALTIAGPLLSLMETVGKKS